MQCIAWLLTGGEGSVFAFVIFGVVPCSTHSHKIYVE